MANGALKAAAPLAAEGKTLREESIQDFQAEWCHNLLKDGRYTELPSRSRKVGGPLGRTYNTLMGKTLNTNHGIRAMRLMHRPPRPSHDTSDGDSSILSTRQTRTIHDGGEVLALITLGDELCSHADVLHGGIVTTIVDEVGGHLAMHANDFVSTMAVNFDVNLRRSVRTPGMIVVRATMPRAPHGRKFWVSVRIEQDGILCVEGEALYLKLLAKV